eukprot:3356446-Prymnesium_polylepis.1
MSRCTKTGVRTVCPVARDWASSESKWAGAPPHLEDGARNAPSLNPSRCVILGFRTGFYPPRVSPAAAPRGSAQLDS